MLFRGLETIPSRALPAIPSNPTPQTPKTPTPNHKTNNSSSTSNLNPFNIATPLSCPRENSLLPKNQNNNKKRNGSKHSKSILWTSHLNCRLANMKKLSQFGIWNWMRSKSKRLNRIFGKFLEERGMVRRISLAGLRRPNRLIWAWMTIQSQRWLRWMKIITTLTELMTNYRKSSFLHPLSSLPHIASHLPDPTITLPHITSKIPLTLT